MLSQYYEEMRATIDELQQENNKYKDFINWLKCMEKDEITRLYGPSSVNLNIILEELQKRKM